MKKLASRTLSRMLLNFKSIDFLLLSSFVAMLIIRIIANYSSWSITATENSNSVLIPLVSYSALSLILICFLSSLDEQQIINLSIGSVALLLICLILVLYMRPSNGASRWLNVFGLFSFQPSEIIKPFLIVTCGNLIYRGSKSGQNRYILFSSLLVLTVFSLVVVEPDLGGSFQILLHWIFILFLSGMPYSILASLAIVLASILFVASLTLPHVFNRVDMFFATSIDGKLANHQVENAIRAIANGGFSGKGPGEGVSKNFVPEAQSDFIFAIISEEFGLIVGIVLLALYSFILLRTYILLRRGREFFSIIAGSGLAFMLTLQMLINLSSVLNLIPTKGLTLPFISAGGSSLLSVSITAGVLLSLTRRKYRREISEYPD